MSADQMPVEILAIIFKKLTGESTLACRAVCRRWRDVVDSLSDNDWKHYCSRDFGNPEAAQKRSNLNFRTLYKSLALWSKVEESDVTSKPLPAKHIRQFKLLNNNTLAVVLDSDGDWFFSNQVEYYNMDTMELTSRIRYDFRFSEYDENERLIAMVCSMFKAPLCVIIKSNNKRYFFSKDDYYVRRRRSGIPCETNSYTLFDTKVYFVYAGPNKSKIVCVARLINYNDNREDAIEIEESPVITEDNILAFARATTHTVNILTYQGKILKYCHRLRHFETCIQIVFGIQNSRIDELWKFGFQWSDPQIYKWLETKGLYVTRFITPVIHSHNHVALIGTTRGSLHIYKRPYNNGNLELVNKYPNKSINLIQYGARVHKLGVTERVNGHRIVVLIHDNVIVLDVKHDPYKTNKRRTSSPCSSNSKKQKTRDGECQFLK